MTSRRYGGPRPPRGAGGRPASSLGLGLLLVIGGWASGCAGLDTAPAPAERVDSAEEALVHACWPPGTPPASAMCAGGFSYLLACPGNPEAEATGCGSDTQYTPPQQTLAQAQAHAAAAWAALGGQGQPVYRAPLTCTSCTDTAASDDAYGCWPAGTPDDQKTCSGSFSYGMLCFAKYASASCPLIGYQLKTCTEYNTCAHRDFGVASRGTRSWSTTIGGGYILVKKCYPGLPCQFEPTPNVTKSCTQVAADERATLPAADASLVTYTSQQGPIQGDGESQWSATCNVTFSNWPTYNSAAGPQCGVKSTYPCSDLSNPIYASCRHVSHPIVPVTDCGVAVRQTGTGLTMAQVQAQAQSAWEDPAVGGVGAVRFAQAPMCSSCVDVLPTASPDGLTPGALHADVSATSDGAASVAVPLWVPEGRAGLAPHLGLAYSSRGGNGPLGVGFGLTGLSRITRCAKTLAQDGEARDVQMDAGDRFCLDGRQLVAVNGGVYGANGTEYRTEDNSFTKVVSLPSDGSGPTAFRAYLKDGRILTFGGEVWTRVEGRRLLAARNPQGGPTVESLEPVVRYAWLLAREEDRSGNFISYTYSTNTGDDWNRDSERLPAEISYTGHAPSGREPKRFVRFSYENRPDVDEAYVSGLKIVTSRRLKRIEVWGPSPSSQAPLRLYWFTYQNTSISGRSQLTEVKECDGMGLCKRPTKFEWSQGSWAFNRRVVRSTGYPDGLSGDTVDAVYVGDFEGHGHEGLLPRVPVSPITTWWVFAGNDKHSASPEQAMDPAMRVTDINGDGIADIFKFTDAIGITERSWIRMWKKTVSSGRDWRNEPDPAELSTTWTSTNHGPPPLYFADLDGDGLPEAARIIDTKDGSSWPYRWGYRPNTNGTLGAYIPISSVFAAPGYPSYPARVDGSGRTSLLIPELPVSPSGVIYLQALRLGASGMEVSPTTLPTGASSSSQRYWFADLNGDGLEDALSLESSGGTPMVYINTGRGYRTAVVPALAPEHQVGPFVPVIGGSAMARPGIFIADIDSDGKEEIVLAQQTAANLEQRTKWLVLRPRGSTITAQELDVPLGLFTNAGPAHAQLLDINGDGLTDILQTEPSSSYPKPDLVVYERTGSPPDLLQAVVDGELSRRELSYRPVVQDPSYSAGVPDLPRARTRKSIWVVNEVRLDNGLGGPLNRYTHNYSGGIRDLLRGWLGFEYHKVKDEQTGVTTETRYDVSRRVGNAYPSAGRPVYQRTQATLATGWTHVTETATIYEAIQEQNGKVRFAYPQRIATVTVDLPPGQSLIIGRSFLPSAILPSIGVYPAEIPGAVVTGGTDTVRVYDADGNVTSESVKRLYAGQYTGEEVLATTTYAPRDAAQWLIGLPQTRVVTHTTALGDAATRTTAFEHHPTTGLLTAEVVEPNSSLLRRRTEIQHNAFGLPRRIDTSDAAGHHRELAIEYDSVDEMYPAVLTNGLGHQARSAYHTGLGVPVAETAPNGAKTRYQYDGFGRLRSVDRPDGSDVSRSYAWAFDGVVEVTTQEADGSMAVVRLDKLGREVERRTIGFDGQYVITRRVYDGLWRLAAASAPHALSEPEQLTTYAYDPLGRVLSATRPDNTKVQHVYWPDRTETIDARNHVSYVLHDGAGRVVESADDPFGSAALKTRFVHGPFDLPKQIDVLENGQPHVVTKMGYDGLGRRTLLEEYYSGSTTAGHREATQYNAFGQVVLSVDGKGQQTSFKYDALGRPTQRTSPEGATAFTWDTAPGAGVGKLASTTSADGVAVSYAYDGLGRLVDSTTTIDGSSYTVSRQYDAVGRLFEVGYPSVVGQTRLRARYLYTAHGHLAAVKNPDSALEYWRATTVDARGKVRAESFGNGVTSFHHFDPVRFVPTYTETFDANDALLQDLWLGFDANGNLVQRNDYVNQVHEMYTYDSHDRLATWQVSTSVAGGTSPTQYQYYYDGLGRLTFRGLLQGSGDETEIGYANTGTVSPYAPVWSEAGDYNYDPNGNQVSGPGRTVQFTSFNLPKRVDRMGGAWTSYRYGADQGRAVKETSAGEKTTYVEDMYERRAKAGQVDHVFYVRANGRVVAQATWKEQSGSITSKTVSYLHTDHLGSPEVLTDGNSTPTYQRHDPFGRRVSPFNPVQPLGAATFGVRLGFTGHEMDDDSDLVNMRGRIYDPYLGHFLSRDPIVQDPFDPKSHNRYSYVGYNPLSFTDPSGFSGLPVIIISMPGPGGGGSDQPGDSGPGNRLNPGGRSSDGEMYLPPHRGPEEGGQVDSTPGPATRAEDPLVGGPTDSAKTSVSGWQKSYDGHNFGMMYQPGAAGYPLPAVHPVQIFAAMVADLADSFKGVYGFGGVEAKWHGARGGKLGGERLGLAGYDRERGAWLGSLDGVAAGGGPLPTVVYGTEEIYYLRDDSGETEHLLLVEKSSAIWGGGGWVNRDHPDQLGAYLFLGPALEIWRLELSSFVGIGIDIHFTFPRTKQVWDQASGSY